jgi:hypothetical protein
MNRFFACVLVLAAFAISGCPGCFSSSRDFCVESAKVSCQLQFRCCTAQERQALFGGTNLAIGPYHDEGGCVDAFVRQCEASSQATDEAIAAGRITFDQDRANQCLNTRREAVATCDADTLFNNIDDCNDLFDGAVADGDTCFNTNECAEAGSTCEIENEPNPDGTFVVTLAGTCKGQGDLGEPCLPGGQCNDENLRCLTDADTFEQSCENPRGPGERCQNNFDCQDGLRCEFGETDLVCTAAAGPGEDCDFDDDCQEGLACLEDADFNTTCQVRGGAGVRCFGDDDCQNGLLCATDPDTFREVCQATAGSGEPCPDGDTQCQPGLSCRFDNNTSDNRCFGGANNEPCDFGDRCAPGLVCRFDAFAGRDECQPLIPEGETCDPFDTNFCEATLRCVDDGSFNFSCVDPLPPNAPCNIENSIDPCDNTHRCRFDNTAAEEICVPRLGAGATCNAETDCNTGLFCDFGQGRCVGLKNEGTACTQDRECASGLTCRFNDAQNQQICRGVSDAGEGCEEDIDCNVGLDCRFDDNGTREICRGLSNADERCQAQGDCGPGLDCRFNDEQTFEICRALSGDGETCEDVLDCDNGLDCRQDPNDFRNKCLGPGAAGDVCGDDSDCTAPLACRFNNNLGQTVCSELLGNGEPCPSGVDTDCELGLRCRDVLENGNFICTDKKDFGDDCEEDTDCLSGFCDPDGQFCSEEPPEVDFEICNGLN